MQHLSRHNVKTNRKTDGWTDKSQTKRYAYGIVHIYECDAFEECCIFVCCLAFFIVLCVCDFFLFYSVTTNNCTTKKKNKEVENFQEPGIEMEEQ